MSYTITKEVIFVKFANNEKGMKKLGFVVRNDGYRIADREKIEEAHKVIKKATSFQTGFPAVRFAKESSRRGPSKTNWLGGPKYRPNESPVGKPEVLTPGVIINFFKMNPRARQVDLRIWFNLSKTTAHTYYKKYHSGYYERPVKVEEIVK